MNPYYKDYAELLGEKFPGIKVQKLSVNAGFSCPNRDGTISRGGCIYCDNRSFTPSYCRIEDSVAEQIRKGRDFFARKYPEMKYLAYFQSFTATHRRAPEILQSLYEEAIMQPDVVGLIIGTRPDCLPPRVMDILEELNHRLPVIVEIGAETSHDSTLSCINRCHLWKDVENAVRKLNEREIDCGLHLIAGLPGEEIEDMLLTIERCCDLPISSIKLHQLQVIRDTPLHRMIERGEIEWHPFDVEMYLDFCEKVIMKVGRKLAIERFISSAPPEMVVSPKWGLKNYEFVNMLHRRLQKMKNNE